LPFRQNETIGNEDFKDLQNYLNAATPVRLAANDTRRRPQVLLVAERQALHDVDGPRLLLLLLACLHAGLHVFALLLSQLNQLPYLDEVSFGFTGVELFVLAAITWVPLARRHWTLVRFLALVQQALRAADVMCVPDPPPPPSTRVY
jgi:hypothetical protein